MFDHIKVSNAHMAYTKSCFNDIYANYFKTKSSLFSSFVIKNNASFYFQLKCNDKFKTAPPHFDNSV